jgi:hypothetical protein
MRNGGYSVTMRTESYKPAGVRGVMDHAIRSVEEKNGVFRSHSNTNIDASRTASNVVWVNDGHGGFVEAETPQQIHEHRKSVLAKRADKQKLRKNQNVMMETLLQLDEEFAGNATEYLADSNGNAEETRRLLKVLTDHIVDKVGQDNVNYIALHVDETSPHVHIGWTPLAKDGSLDFRKILGETRLWKKDGRMRGTLTKKMMSDHHKEVRALMNEHGYPAVEVFSAPRHEKHEVYKRQQQQLDAAFAEREGAVKERENNVERLERGVKRRKDELDTGKKQLKDDQEQLKADRDAFAKQQEEQQRAHNEQVAKSQRDLKKRKEDLAKEEAAAKKRLENERATMLADVESREKRVGEREQAVEKREDQQKQARKAVNQFLNSRYSRNAMEHPTEVPREQAQLVNAVSDLYDDLRPQVNLAPQAREPLQKGSVDTRPKSRTPNSAKKQQSNILEEMEEARKKREAPDF